MKSKYFLKAFWQEEWDEVDQKCFIEAERRAGFRPKPGCGPVATGGFSGGGIHGKVVHILEEQPDNEKD